MIDLDEIEARAKAAADGPWEAHRIPYDESAYVVLRVSEHDDDPGQDIVEGVLAEGDAEFIAAARTDIPALVDEIRRLRRASA